MAEKPTLGYWACQARGDPIRTLLSHLEVDFEDKMYQFGDEGPEGWGAQKSQLGIQFPNLPYWKDGDVFHSEHVSIMNSICRKYKPEYLGRTLQEQGNVDCFINAIHGEAMKWFMPYMFSADQADKLEEGKAAAKALVDKFADIRGHNSYLLGSELTVVDFFLLWFLRVLKFHEWHNLDHSPSMSEYFQKMCSVSGVNEAKQKQMDAKLLPFAPICGWQKNNMP